MFSRTFLFPVLSFAAIVAQTQDSQPIYRACNPSAKTYRSMVEEQMSRDQDFRQLGQEQVTVENGEPVDVETQITVKFKLTEKK